MNEHIARVLKSSWTIPVAVGVTSFGGGLGLGYILWGRKTDIERLEEEDHPFQPEFDFDTEGMAEAREDARIIVEEEGYSPPVLAPESDAVIVDDTVVVSPTRQFVEDHLQDDIPATEEEEMPEELVQVNVFEAELEGWNWEEEVAKREENAGEPYILHEDEFHRDELGYTQTQLRYFEGDDIMVDPDNQPIYNHLAVTGELAFGHGSKDPDVVFVRNEDRRGEYEIHRVDGLYSVEILGLEIEENERVKDLRHSKVGRFRMD